MNVFRRHFLTEREREQIGAGLAEAQRCTRAPIGLIIEERSSLEPAARARSLFGRWELSEAERPTAVLLYVRATPPAFAVTAGDEVWRLAPDGFWRTLERNLGHHFDDRRYCDAIFKAIAEIALQLERLFPPAGRTERG